jgi:hypothetical protein
MIVSKRIAATKRPMTRGLGSDVAEDIWLVRFVKFG